MRVPTRVKVIAAGPVALATPAVKPSINNAAVKVFLLGSYRPSKVVTAWDDPNSSLTFTNALLTPDCTVSSTVVSSPKFHVQSARHRLAGGCAVAVDRQ